VCLLTLITALLLTGCSGPTFALTGAGSNTYIQVNNASDGDAMESQPFSVGKGRVAVVESSLDQGKLRIDFTEVTIFRHENEPDEQIVGDVVASVVVGPGDKTEVALERGDYVLQITAVGDTGGKVAVILEKN